MDFEYLRQFTGGQQKRFLYFLLFHVVSCLFDAMILHDFVGSVMTHISADGYVSNLPGIREPYGCFLEVNHPIVGCPVPSMAITGWQRQPLTAPGIDGYAARALNQESRLGYYLDAWTAISIDYFLDILRFGVTTLYHVLSKTSRFVDEFPIKMWISCQV